MKTTISIADDHEMMRQSLASMLSRYFDVSISANNGLDLINQIEKSNNIPDVVILGVKMPVMDGFETALTLKQRWPEIKIIAFSMSDNPEIINRMMDNGADKY